MLLLYTLGVVVGLVLLILPGVYPSVHWYFAAQAAVVDGVWGKAALDVSGRVTEDSWLRVFGTLLLLAIVAGFVGYLIGALIGLGVGAVTDSGVATVLVNTFGRTIALSISALGGTLLFFDLRRGRGMQDPPLSAT